MLTNDSFAEAFVYEPCPISHEELRFDGEKAAGTLTVTLPIEHPLSVLYQLEPEALQTWLRLAYPAVGAYGNTTRIAWFGQVIQAEYSENRCKFTLHSVEKLLARNGLTAKHPRACGHALYDRRTCRVKPNSLDGGGYFAYREDGFIESVSEDGRTVVVSAAALRASGFFGSEGYLVIDGRYTRLSGAEDHFVRGAGSPVEGCDVYGGWRRSVVSQVGASLTLAVPLPPGVYTGKRVTLYAGCNGTQATCLSKFDNGKNFGGFPFIPIKNAFEVGLKNAKGG